MSEPRYEIRIRWSHADHLYLAEMPELPGAVAHGSTYEEALANAREVIRLWLELAGDLDWPVPRPKASGRRKLSQV